MFTRKKKSKKKKIALSIVGIILSIIFAVLIYTYLLISKINNVELNKNNLGISKDVENLNTEIKNIALFGVDSEKNSSRADIIIILTVDELHGKTKLTSIMKDSYVNIPDKGMDKINKAYEYGGAELAIKTINENFGLNIKDFLTIDFKGFQAIIDGLGGVQIKILEEEFKYINGLSSGGVKNLTGAQAFDYLKIKNTENAENEDLQRNQRERKTIEALYEVYKYTPITKYPKIVRDFLPYVTTNISVREMITIGKTISSTVNKGVKQDEFPRTSEVEKVEKNNSTYLIYDLEKAKQEMRESIFENK